MDATRESTKAFLVVLLLWPGLAESRNLHRSLFYEETPFGSLAWVNGVATRASARSKFTVEDLSIESCVRLPPTGAQWFMVNHRDVELEGEVGYFAIRIVYDFGNRAGLDGTQPGLHLQRNGNWYGDDGLQISGTYERSSEQIALPLEEFIKLHDPSMDQDAERRAELQRAIGSWHMRPSADAENSWFDRYLYGPMLRASVRGATGAISARLIRYTVTASTSSNEPVLFWLEPRGATSATIWVDAPRQTYSGSKRVYTVMFGKDCPVADAIATEATAETTPD